MIFVLYGLLELLDWIPKNEAISRPYFRRFLEPQVQICNFAGVMKKSDFRALWFVCACVSLQSRDLIFPPLFSFSMR